MKLIWGHISFILGICGNVFVLYATIFHNAIKLDKMSIWIIKNLAVVDLCNCIFIVFPVIAKHFSEGKWIFGSGLCYIHAIIQHTFIGANLALVNFISLNKLLRCKYPLRNLSPSRFQKILVTTLSLLVSSIPIVWLTTGLDQGLMLLNQQDLLVPGNTCIADIVQNKTSHVGTSRIVASVLTIALVGTSCLALVITTTALLVYAIKKTNRPINKRNIFTVILVTVTFLLSFFPFLMYMAGHRFLQKFNTDSIYEWAFSFTFFSSWSNPISYLLMNKNFKEFAKTRFFANN